MEQLSIELGSGRVELRSVLLDCDALNHDLVSCNALILSHLPMHLPK